jgi:polar amino acid transport system substrate-binding protein
MRLTWLTWIATLALLGGCASSSQVMPTAAEKQALAPTGKLRIAFLANNAVHATRDPVSGELRGPAIDVGKELARRLGVPFEAVQYRTQAELVGSVSKGAWDVAALGANPERRKVMDFSAPYAQIEIGILVGNDVPIASLAELDRAGVRVAAQARGGSDVLLTNSLKQATLVRTRGVSESLELVKSGQADAASALKTYLIPAAEQIPGSRILAGSLSVEDIALAVPKGDEAGARYVSVFIDELKANGLVNASIERWGVRGLMAAP